jgi:hypothetical protein
MAQHRQFGKDFKVHMAAFGRDIDPILQELERPEEADIKFRDLHATFCPACATRNSSTSV